MVKLAFVFVCLDILTKVIHEDILSTISLKMHGL
jgi:hypothetical protein